MKNFFSDLVLFYHQYLVLLLIIPIPLIAGFFLWFETRKNRLKIDHLINARTNLSDEMLCLEFGANSDEWAKQLKVLKNLAKTLSLPYAGLRPNDNLAFLSEVHRFSGDKLLEFELIISKNKLGEIKTVGELIKAISKINY